MTMSDSNKTVHSFTIGGLAPNTLYHYIIQITSTEDTNDFDIGQDRNFTTITAYDSGTTGDAGSSIGNSATIEPGHHYGSLTTGSDVIDFYQVWFNSGQAIMVNATVPTGYQFKLSLYDTSNIRVTYVSGAGAIGLSYVLASTGYWKIKVELLSGGTGNGGYWLDWSMLAKQDSMVIDVGLSNDTDQAAHPLSIYLIAGSGWFESPSNNMRETDTNGAFCLNLYGSSYQSLTDWQITVRYTSAEDAPVAVFDGRSWVNVTTLPGKTTAWSYTFVLSSSFLYDSDATSIGMNVKMRLGQHISVDRINALSYSYSADLINGKSYIVPAIRIEEGWSIADGLISGGNASTLLIDIPRTDVAYMIKIDGLNDWDGIELQQLTSSGYTSLGTLAAYSGSAVILLKKVSYHDISPNIGTTIRVKIVSEMRNVTGMKLVPASYMTDLGVNTGDSIENQHTPGIRIIDDGIGWNTATTTYRQTKTSVNACFILHGAFSDDAYAISITYKTTSSNAWVYQWDGSTYRQLFKLTSRTSWYTSTFLTNPSWYSDVSTSKMFQIQLCIQSSVGVMVDGMSCSRDSDGDLISDAQESNRTGNNVKLDPFSSDTDSDGWSDSAELTEMTDQTDPDTDNDGLLDGSEIYSYSWSTDSIIRIDSGGATTMVNVTLPIVDGTVNAFWVHVGMTHPDQGNLTLSVRKGSGSWTTILANGAGSGSNLFKSWNLFDLGISSSALDTSGVWQMSITNSGSDCGSLSYVKYQVDGMTSPLDDDTDGDYVPDGEEVGFGVDGWYTNPMSKDSDSDGLNDYKELYGATPSHKVSDPTRADTDDDGFQDNVDKDPLGDVLMKVTFNQLYLADDVNGVHSPNLFIGIRSNGIEYFTEHFSATHGQYTTLGLSYYFDIWDSNYSMQFKMTVVAYRPNTVGDDIKIDAGGDAGDGKEWWYTFNTTYSSQTVTNSGSDVVLTAKFEKVVQQRANTIVVEGLQDNQTYGLTKIGTMYRYDADDQVILLYLNCSSSYMHFVSGTNVIILPRSVALGSQLNDTLFGIDNITSTDPLFEATFCYADDDEKSSSYSVIAVISKNVTGAQAEAVLEAITHDTSNGRVGNNVSLTSVHLYLLHLPQDVLSHIPMTEFVNSDTGNAPNYLSWSDIWESLVNTVVSAAEFVYNGIVAIAELYLDINRALADIGLAVVGMLVAYHQTVIDTIIEIAEMMVDVYMALLDWVIELIENIAQTFLSPIVSTFSDILDNVCGEIRMRAHLSYQSSSGGLVNDVDLLNLSNAIFNGLLAKVAIIAAIAIKAIILAINGLTCGTAFLISIATSLIISTLLIGIFQSIPTSSWNGGTIGSSASSIMSIAGISNSSSNLQYNWLDAVCTMIGLGSGSVGIIVGASLSMLGIISVIIGIISAVVGLYSFLECDDLLSWIGVALGVIGMIITYQNLKTTIEKDVWVTGLALGLSSLAIGASITPLLS
jgi:hypothetical protein